MEAASADNKGASPASPQGAGGAEGAGRASNDASRGSDPAMSSTEGQIVMAECWKEFTEETMRANIEYAKAAHNARKAVDRDHPMEPPQGDVFANWDSLSAYLCYMGYDPDNADGWLRLGIPKVEGPAPTIELIEDRFKRAKWVLGVQALMAQWQAQDVVKARKESEGMAVARSQCLKELKGVLRDRQKVNGFVAPRFMQPPKYLEQWVSGACDKPIVSALWFSNMRRENIEATGYSLPTLKARQLAEGLCGGAGKAEKSSGGTPGQVYFNLGATLWGALASNDGRAQKSNTCG